MKAKTLALAFVLFLGVFARAEEGSDSESEKHPIDITMETAMEKDPSTAGMVRAISDANTAWDKEMNSLYKKLKAQMQSDEWEALQQAQRAWVAYRDLQEKSIVASYGKNDGTMWIPMSADAVMQLTRQRALLLGSLLEVVTSR